MYKNILYKYKEFLFPSQEKQSNCRKECIPNDWKISHQIMKDCNCIYIVSLSHWVVKDKKVGLGIGTVLKHE